MMMKLSSLDVISTYRLKLMRLRAARNSVADPTFGGLTCFTVYDGDKHDICELLSRPSLKQSLASMLDYEICETVRALEDHGVVVDE